MDANRERQRGNDAGRRWAKVASAHEVASIVSGSFDEVCLIMPPDVSDQFIGGFREGVLHVWRGE